MFDQHLLNCETFDDYLSINSLKKVRIIGAGEFGKVFLVEKTNCELFAVKVMYVAKFNPQEWELTKLLKGFDFELFKFF
jgi:hypothetical protein